MNKGNTTILRFPVQLNATSFVLDVPKGAELVEIGNDPMRGGAPQIWFAGNPEAETEQRAFCRADTGQALPYKETDLRWFGRAIGLGSSKSNPGNLTPRTVHYFAAMGDAAEQIIALHEATVTEPE